MVTLNLYILVLFPYFFCKWMRFDMPCFANKRRYIYTYIRIPEAGLNDALRTRMYERNR